MNLHRHSLHLNSPAWVMARASEDPQVGHGGVSGRTGAPGFSRIAATKQEMCSIDSRRRMKGVAAGLLMRPLTIDLEVFRPRREVEWPWVKMTYSKPIS